jgi:hypothetical protein
MTSLERVRAPSAGRDLRLWRSVVLLAEPPPEMNPPPNGVPGQSENFVFEFDEAYTAYVEGFESLPSEGQMLALQAVDRKVAQMVAMKEAAIWTEAARRENAHWLELRSLASRVLVEFDWPDFVS